MATPDPGKAVLPRPRGRLRPVHAVGPVAGSVFTLLAWAAIAHNSGSGWVQALGATLGATLLVGIVAPAWLVAHTGIAVRDAPVDGVAGEPLDLEVVATARVRVIPVAPVGKTSFVGPVARDEPGSHTPVGQEHDPAAVNMSGTGRATPTLQVVPARRDFSTRSR